MDNQKNVFSNELMDIKMGDIQYISIKQEVPEEFLTDKSTSGNTKGGRFGFKEEDLLASEMSHCHSNQEKNGIQEISIKEEVTEEFLEDKGFLSDANRGIFAFKREDLLASSPSGVSSQHSNREEARMDPLMNDCITQFIDVSQSNSLELQCNPMSNPESYPRSETVVPPMDGSSGQYKSTPQVAAQVNLKMHTGKNLFKCTSCPYQSPKRDNFKRHSRTHSSEKPFKCHLCPYQGTIKQNFVKHLRKHSGEKPFKCSSCPYQAATTEAVKRHSYSHTGEKPFKCCLCSYSATDKDMLVKHFRGHTGEKPFKCSFCPYQAARKDTLNIHSRIHTCEKPFKCSYCPYQASTKGNIKRHLYTHSGEKPFKCNSCPYQAARIDDIKRHFHTHKSNLVSLQVADQETPTVGIKPT